MYHLAQKAAGNQISNGRVRLCLRARFLQQVHRSRGGQREGELCDDRRLLMIAQLYVLFIGGLVAHGGHSSTQTAEI